MQRIAACPFGGLLNATALQLANLSCFAVHEPERLWEFAPSAGWLFGLTLSPASAHYTVCTQIEKRIMRSFSMNAKQARVVIDSFSLF